jgi:hypothetical protein
MVLARQERLVAKAEKGDEGDSVEAMASDYHRRLIGPMRRWAANGQRMGIARAGQAVSLTWWIEHCSVRSMVWPFRGTCGSPCDGAGCSEWCVQDSGGRQLMLFHRPASGSEPGVSYECREN